MNIALPGPNLTQNALITLKFENITLTKKLNHVMKILFIQTHLTVDCNSFLFRPYILSFDLCIIICLTCISFLWVCALLNKWDSTICSACICCDLLTICALNKWGNNIINNTCLLSLRRAAVICLGNSVTFVTDKILFSLHVIGFYLTKNSIFPVPF